MRAPSPSLVLATSALLLCAPAPPCLAGQPQHALATAAAPVGLPTIHIDNHSPRLQTTPRADGSRVLNSHDGFIVYRNRTFYHYGIVQPNCTGGGDDGGAAPPLATRSSSSAA